jgi:hypothetical protein
MFRRVIISVATVATTLVVSVGPALANIEWGT